MKDLIAKRYVKALLDGREADSVAAITNELAQIATAFADDKFIAIITSTEVASDKKVELVVSLVEGCSEATTNLIKLLGSNKRLDIIPFIVNELQAQAAALNNSFTGVVYTNSELGSDYVASIEEKFSKKFDVNLTLTQNVCDYDGIKVDIEGLGVEISFSKDRLKSQMINHILKAV